MKSGRTLNELSIIPTVARIVAAIVYLIAGTAFFLVFTHNPNDPPWPVAVKAVLALLVPLPLAVYVLAVGYVYGDSRRRRMRYVVWTLLAIFVPNMIGILLYFLMRDPVPAYCPACGSQVRPGFAHCPHCGTRLAAECPNCSRPVESGWSNCAFCGVKL